MARIAPMPELPEVETIARGLRSTLTEATVGKVPHFRPDYVLCPSGNPADVLVGRTIAEVGRHGKRLCLRLAPAGEVFLHLGMSGRVEVVGATRAVEPHTHLRVRFRGRRDELRMIDPRRFGGVWVSDGLTSAGTAADGVEGAGAEGADGAEGKNGSNGANGADAAEPKKPRILRNGAHPGGLGPDALAIPWKTFRQLMQRRRQVKALLLDQASIAGLGNIYVDEALWAAQLHPQVPADEIEEDDARALHRAVRRILRKAIEQGGSTLRDYRDAEGAPGRFQARHQVYGRQGDPCRRCRGTILREIVAGRSTHFCPECQQ